MLCLRARPTTRSAIRDLFHFRRDVGPGIWGAMPPSQFPDREKCRARYYRRTMSTTKQCKKRRYPTARYTCPVCQVQLPTARRVHHEKSLFHNRIPTIRRLLERPSVGFNEIGRKVGLSRERIRKLATLMGQPAGRKRHETARNQRLNEKLLQHPVLGKLVNEARKHGLKVEAIQGLRMYKTRVLINGRLCSVSNPEPVIKNRKLYFRISGCRMKDDVKFILVHCENTGWMILPRHKAPQKSTRFVLGRDRLNPGGRNRRHDWPQYLDAWHQLV